MQNIPLTLAREVCIEGKECSLELRVSEERKTWPIKLRLYESAGNAHLVGRGWKKFALDNNLLLGDVCVFEFIRCTKMLNIIIYRNDWWKCRYLFLINGYLYFVMSTILFHILLCMFAFLHNNLSIGYVPGPQFNGYGPFFAPLLGSTRQTISMRVQVFFDLIDLIF